MIAASGFQLEHRKLAEVAKGLEASGYQVIVAPRDEQLPAFLKRFRPSLIATRGDQGVVVEVKTRQTLPESQDLPGLAEVVRGQPGWRLDLLITDPKDKPVAGLGDRLDQSDIRSRIGEAKELLSNGSHVAAMLLAWSAAEGAMRLLAQRADIRIEKDDPGFVVRKLAMHGFVDDAEYRVLRPAIDVRNALVYGYSSPRLDARLVSDLVAVADRLMHPPAAHSA